MKICFIWVRSFRNFENFGFNLSSSSKFQYNDVTNVLSQKEIDPLPEDFFGPSIKDVVVIVGKNGAGKSNAIELVCKILKGAKTSLQTDFLIITEDNNQLVCHCSSLSNIKPSPDFEIILKEYEGNISPLKIVFFSNVFDGRKNDFDKEVSDISVNNLFVRGKFLRNRKASDFEQQIKLINSKIFESLNIDPPTKVQVSSLLWTNRFNISMERDFYGTEMESLRDFKKIIRKRIREIRPENKFVHLLRFGFFFELIDKYARMNRSPADIRQTKLRRIDRFVKDLLSLRTEEMSDRLSEFMKFDLLDSGDIDTIFSEPRVSRSTIYYGLDWFLKQIDFLEKLKFSISNFEIGYSTEGNRNRGVEHFVFDYDSNSNDFFDEYVLLFGELSDFSISWLGISSGHNAYLNLFASLFQELKHTRLDNLLLCIDEGDLYLHPKWQIEFFDKLLEILPEIYSGNIQLIMTSHSPFLLSDLPNQNITILDTRRAGSTLDGIDLKTNTFGGNLYNLYSEPFFLGDKRTSCFAYNKISEIIKLAEGRTLTAESRKEISKIVNLLGDEIIQFRLKQLLAND